jgi:hypothetical protein
MGYAEEGISAGGGPPSPWVSQTQEPILGRLILGKMRLKLIFLAPVIHGFRNLGKMMGIWGNDGDTRKGYDESGVLGAFSKAVLGLANQRLSGASCVSEGLAMPKFIKFVACGHWKF